MRFSMRVPDIWNEREKNGNVARRRLLSGSCHHEATSSHKVAKSPASCHATRAWLFQSHGGTMLGGSDAGPDTNSFVDKFLLLGSCVDATAKALTHCISMRGPSGCSCSSAQVACILTSLKAPSLNCSSAHKRGELPTDLQFAPPS